MSNKTNWLWALRDKEKAMKTMGLSPVKQEQATPSPTVGNNQKTSIQSTAPIIKEPKREAVSWSDDDSLDTWDDRSFLEGFYEVDGTVNDWEREKRMSQVDQSLEEIERRKRKATPGTSLRSTSPGKTDTSKHQKLPGNPNAPAQITKFPYYDGRYPAYTNYVNAANKNIAVSKSGDTTRPPTQEELEAAYAAMQKGFSGQNALQHINDAAEYVTNAATPQNNTQRKTQTATTTSTAQTQSRDARVRENYRARQQAEADARYEDFDIEAAEEKLRDNDYWTDRLLESRKQGYGFAGDEQIAEERNALEQEIKSAKDAAERRRERYINSIPDLPDFEGVSSSGDGKIYISELEHPEYLSYATDEEKKIYTYLKNKEGTESANSYLKHLEPELTARKGKETGQAVLDGGALMYLPYAAYAGLEQFTGGVEQLLSKNAVPTTATRHASQYISDNAKGVGKLAYDVTSSIANMAPSVALGTLNPALGSAAMFGSVYGNSYNSALHEGKDRGEAQTYATLRAVSETALQNILGGTSALGGKMPEALVGSIKNINNAAYRIAAKYGKSILSEGSEEYLQKILQPVIRNLAFGEDNKFRVISEDAAYAGLMGALTAGVFETGNIVRGENWDNTPPPVTINKNPIIQDILKTENNVGELAKPYPKENLPKEVAEWIRKLPQYKDAIEISSTPSHEQISLLSRQEGVEFASITIGNRNIIIRGDTSGTPISQDLLEDMIRNKGVLNCHSHPYIGDFRPSESDLYIAHILSHQEEFEIITPDNMRAVYTKHGIKSVGNIERKLSEQDVLELYKLFGG